MTIQEAKKYLEENPNGAVIAPNGVVCYLTVFKANDCWTRSSVFGEWKAKREPRVTWINEYSTGYSHPYSSRDAADKGAAEGRVRCIQFVEVLDETT